MENAVRGNASRYREVRRILWTILALNVLVALAKFGWGTISGSMAMTNDGIASFFDGFSNLVGLLGVRIAAKPPDASHPYGHAKYETYASAVIGVALLIAAAEIATKAISSLVGGESVILVDWVSYAVMVGTLVVNLGVSIWESRQGARLKSEVLEADAKHTRSDAYVSVSVICSLVFVQLGIAAADAVVSLLVAVAVLGSAISIFRQASRTLGDASRLSTVAVARLVETVPGVRSVHEVRSRGSEGEVYVDLHILLDPEMTLMEAHDRATEVERLIEEIYPEVADVMVHMEPDVAEERRDALGPGIPREEYGSGSRMRRSAGARRRQS